MRGEGAERRYACARRAGEDDEHAVMPCCNQESTSKIGAVLQRAVLVQSAKAVLEPQRSSEDASQSSLCDPCPKMGSCKLLAYSKTLGSRLSGIICYYTPVLSLDDVAGAI